MNPFLHRTGRLFFVFILCSQIAFSQQAFFEEQTTPQGAPAIRNVLGMIADSNNCIWIPTQSGIYRYDGLKFRHYNDQNTSALQYERMAGIATALSEKNKLLCIQDALGNLYQVNKQSRIEPFNTGQKAVFAFGTISVPFYFFDQSFPGYKSYAGKILNAYLVSNTNTLYLRLTGCAMESVPVNSFIEGKPGKTVYSWNKENRQVQFATDNYFYAIDKGGVRQWNDLNNKFTNLPLTGDILAINQNIINYDSLGILQSNDKKFTFAWLGHKLYEVTEELNNKSLKTRLIAEMPAKDEPVQIFYSKEQHLLIIYYKTKGLVFYRPKQFSLLSYNQNKNVNSDDYYYSLVPYKNGLSCVIDNGLIWFGENGKTEMLAKDSCLKFFLFKDSAQDIWYQTASLDIKRYSSTKKTSEKILTAEQLQEFSNRRFDAKNMLQKGVNNYYLLTQSYLIDLSLKKDKPLLKTLIGPLDKTEFSLLFARDAQTLWLGTDQGLLEYNTAEKSYKTIPSLNKASIRSITKIGENNYLAGTYNKGIFQYKDGRWSHLSNKMNNLPSSAHSFEIDSLTNSVWVSSNEGLIRLSLSQLQNSTPEDSSSISAQHLVNFGPGILPEFNGSHSDASAKLSDTSIAFANATGLVTFNPRNIVAYPLPVKAWVEPVNEADNDSIPSYNYKLDLVEFSPVISYFGDPEELEVSYFLTNYDKEWHLQIPGSVIIYRQLPPGEHTLQFRIRHVHDFTGRELVLPATTLFIPYKWYQKTGNQLLLAALFLLLLIALHNLRIAFIHKRKRELEKLVQTKTAELVEANENLVTVIDELTTSETKLKKSNFLKDEYYALLTHDIRSPLKFLSFNLGYILERMTEMDKAVLKKGIVTAYQSSNDLNKLIDEFVYWIQDNEKEIKIKPEHTSISTIASGLKKLFAFGMETNRNIFVSEIPDDLYFFIDANILFMILRNAVDNANKYTVQGEIRMAAFCENKQLQITVTDTGMGMNEDMVKNLMQIQYDDIPLSASPKKSLGFYIMAMLIKKLGGSYNITSTKEEGTCIRFIIPASVMKDC